MTFYFNVLNVFACIAVVMLHCNSCFWNGPAMGESAWVSATFIETAMYWAVPIFYMLTGAKLMDYRKRMTTKDYFKKRFIRTGIPFIVWSIIGIIYLAIRRPGHVEMDPLVIVDKIMGTDYIAVYWFFITLFCIYLSIPVWSMISDRLKVFRYILIATFICQSVLPLLCNLIGIGNPNIYPTVAVGYSVFAILGYHLANIDISRRGRKIIYVLAIFGWALHFGGTLLLSSVEGGIDSTFKGYANVPSYLFAVGVFVFFKYRDYSKFPCQKLINNLSRLTFGIYLMHIYFIWELPNLFGFSNLSILWRTAGAFLVFGICAIITYIIRKIPIINKILLP